MRQARLLLITLAIAFCAAAGATDAIAQIWWVQSADYGAGNQRQDVTNTVRRLVNGPNFRVNNANLAPIPLSAGTRPCASWPRTPAATSAISLTGKARP